MDQVKLVLAVLGKYHFWVVAGLVVITVAVIYTSAAGTLTSQFETGKQDIESKISSINSVQGPVPTKEAIEATRQKILAWKKDTLKAWEFLYKNQKKENPWPAELGKEFLAMIDALPPDGEIPLRFRDLYRNFYREHYPALFDIIELRHHVLLDAEGKELLDAAGNVVKLLKFDVGTLSSAFKDYPLAVSQEERGKVIWENPEVLTLNTWSNIPSTKQIRLAQENLWVYEALLRIIRQTNEGATSYYNAPIKRIDTLTIGSAASAAIGTSQGRIITGIAGSTATAAAGATFSTTGLGTDEAQLHGRYVGINGEPLAHDAKHPFAEFKMMPVAMKLFMDQRKLPDLLVNCANSTMPVEVIRVSLRPDRVGQPIDLASIVSRAGGTGGAGGGEGSTGGMAFRGGGGTSSTVEYGAIEMLVELQGIIQLFNPPDLAKLGSGSAGEEPGESAPVLVPTNAPPAAAPAEGAEPTPEAAPDNAAPPVPAGDGGVPAPAAAGGAAAPVVAPAGGAAAPVAAPVGGAPPPAANEPPAGAAP